MDVIFNKVDSDKSGYITFSEFLVASINPRIFLSTERMNYAFRYFDIEDCGMINLDDIEYFICAGKLINGIVCK